MNLLCSVDDRWLQVMAARAVQASAPADGLLRLDAVEVGPQHNKRAPTCCYGATGTAAWDFFVDDDLEYIGDDEARRRLFAGPKFQHWLALAVSQPIHCDVHEAVLHLLGLLDSPMREGLPSVLCRAGKADRAWLPCPTRSWKAWPACTARRLGGGSFEPTPLQADAIAQIAAALTQQVSPCCPLVQGCRLRQARSRARCRRVVDRPRLFRQVLEVSGAAVAAGMIFRAQKDERFRRVLDAAQRMERRSSCSASSMRCSCNRILPPPDRPPIRAGLKLIAVARTEFELDRGEALLPLQRRLRIIRIPPMEAADTAEVLNRRLSRHPLAAKWSSWQG